MNLMEAFETGPMRDFTPAEIQQARDDAVRSQQRLVEVLEEKSGLSPQEFMARLANTFHYPFFTMEQLNRLTPAFDVIPYSEVTTRECMAFRLAGGELTVVLPDPFDAALQLWAEERLPESFTWSLVHRADLMVYLARHEETMQAMDGVLSNGQENPSKESAAEDLSLKSIREDTSPAVRLVHSTIYDALKVGASDIHLETQAAGLTIKYRIDGVLTLVGATEGAGLAEQVLSRIKVMSDLDISERRIPQDGRFKVSVKGREIDFRVSVMPNVFGEDAVLRILDKQSLSDSIKGLRLEYLGFDELSIQRLRRLANEPHGMLLVTGPTGSGKTTTLYALITEINHGEDKIITIEDPVEYQLAGVLQIPVNDKKGLTFARGLRSILRHDPDTIMVGEIRDQETAQIAVQSALTGHLVFTTVHANNVFDVIGRFTHMGVDPYSFVSAMNGIVAQRLVRLVCPHCAKKHRPEDQVLAESGISKAMAAKFNLRSGSGCGQCRGSGYKGRKAIAEILFLNDEIRELIVERAPIRRIKEAARANGMHFLRESAVELVRLGETDLQEINRVTFSN